MYKGINKPTTGVSPESRGYGDFPTDGARAVLYKVCRCDVLASFLSQLIFFCRCNLGAAEPDRLGQPLEKVKRKQEKKK